MAIAITIQGVDRTSSVQWASLKIENILTKQVDRCTFKVWNYGDRTFRPRVGREVIITDAGTRVFGGVITKVSGEVIEYPKVEYTIECSDYTRILDQHLVAETYENMTINAIIADLIANWIPTGFTGTQVDCTTVIDFIQFNYEPVSDVLKQLAEIVGFDWYVDYFRDIYFKSPSATPASISITDSGGVYDHNSLVIRYDSSQIRNSIIVRGGEYKGSEFTASIKSDGKRITYELPYRFEDFKVRVNGVRQAVGIDNIDNTLSFDALYNFTEKTVKWRPDNKPVQDATLSYSGKPYLPVIVKLKSPVDIAAIFSAEGSLGDGKYEYLVVDNSINSKEAARERALAEIRSYGDSISEGEFTTETSGLRAGQQILVNSTALNVNEYYVINRVVSVMKDKDTMRYKVSLVTTKTMDFIAIMKKLLLAETKKIIINEGEVIDLVESLDDTITLSEVVVSSLSHNPQTETITLSEDFTPQALDYPTKFVLGDYTPTIGGGGNIDSYSESNVDFDSYVLYDNGSSSRWYTKLGQSITGDGQQIGSCKFYLKKDGSPTGNITASIYAHSGTFGTSSVGTGSALVTSAAIDITTLTTSYQLITFTFASPLTLSAATNYVLVVEFASGDSSNKLIVGVDNSSGTHAGNMTRYLYTGSWFAASAVDTAFYAISDSDPKRVFVLDGSPLG